MPRRCRREEIGVFFPIRQNGLLDDTYNLVYRPSLTIRDLIERRTTERTRSVNLQRAVQVVFGDMVDMGDYLNGHPGMNSAHISRFDSTILLLETSHRLNGIYSSKGQNPQHEKQQKAEKAQLGAFTQRVQLLLTLSDDKTGL